MSSKYLISVVGPTAIGKTRLSIALAKHYKTEIISADSRQFYKEMQIGTAVPEPHELKSVPHHFIQHLSVETDYNVGAFERDAMSRISTLYDSHDVLVMVGGSGLYVDAVVHGLDDFPVVDSAIREDLNRQLKENGLEALQDQLKLLDRMAFDTIAIDNPHRVIRALEISIGSGQPYSSFLKKRDNPRSFEVVSIGLTAERSLIYDRINIRVDRMIDTGLVEEAQNLEPYKHLNALNTVGYKELFNYFDGTWTLEHAISEIKKNTRRFAKRQLTWFRRNDAIEWFDYDTDAQKIIAYIENKKSS